MLGTIEKPTKIADCPYEDIALCEHIRRLQAERTKWKHQVWDLEKVIGKLRTQIEDQWKQMDVMTAERHKRLGID